MAITSAALRYRRLQQEAPEWALLRARNAGLIVAVVQDYFPPERRVRPAAEVIAELDVDLDLLRETGAELESSATAYVASWVSAGYLIRRPGDTRGSETLAPSAAALNAAAMVHGIEAPQRAASASRLGSITANLISLQRDSDPDAETRLELLEAERAAVERRIEEVHSGEFTVLDPESARERVVEALTLADEVPVDFARVRTAIEALSRDLRAKILDDSAEGGATLGNVFRGVDLLAESEAGRSVNGFYDVILDAEQSARVQEAITAILSRDFAAALTAQERIALRTLLSRLEDEAATVRQTMLLLSRSLRHFVLSRQYEEHRRLRQLIQRCQSMAVQVSALHRPEKAMDLQLTRIGMQIRSLAALKLHNPGDGQVPTDFQCHENDAVDFEELAAVARESDIDFDELRENVLSTLARADGPVTAGRVLGDHPATQGLASIVGLMVLGAEHGHTDPTATERVALEQRSVTIPTITFAHGDFQDHR
ncbi:DUF3375 domain-containing protein [Mycolicibacterium brumae]|uniref:DUF3375 domain-containing protein n=1 Tax=Mycolicibacterium brumae TaxID=85968 RepID=A0A2G5PCD1_9MYCO|nr:DUF3375 domain-containing protein [Mycolicibacterium brumae]MCV7193125.1 DUF3375 domain-containing protein [Mycolicibacterium brumae]PIB75991.1 DUF3375 domain-containing protein [Mycolicibacterium brumae]RWA16563.1 hypothetical protein MBRU_07505 [Mycolicibacterium brumae DSM 44177]UWW09780.1 DUF3375 domain-containing protein [Mycolicibacterium brumae]